MASQLSSLSSLLPETSRIAGRSVWRMLPTLAAIFRTRRRVDITMLLGIVSMIGDTSKGISSLRDLAITLWSWVLRSFSASVLISGNDRLQLDVLNGLSGFVLRQRTRVLHAQSETKESGSWYQQQPNGRNDDCTDEPIKYTPAFGLIWFVHEGTFFTARRIPNPGEGKFKMADDLVVTCLGFSADPIKRLLDSCQRIAAEGREGVTAVYTFSNTPLAYAPLWNMPVYRPTRPLETVHLDEAVKRDLIDDIERFLRSKTRAHYKRIGVPHRRGYLLHGPPGTGKTSLAVAIAGHFKRNLCLIHLPSVPNDTKLDALFTSLPNCIVLLEDIDAVGVARRRGPQIAEETDDSDDSDDKDDKTSAPRSHSQVTLSGLLNALDGPLSPEGRIVLMTSNKPKDLDPALTRPGRIDTKIHMGLISPESARLMFLRLCKKVVDAEGDVAATVARPAFVSAANDTELSQLADKFMERIPKAKLTPAELQGFLLENGGNPVEAVEKVASFVAREKKASEEK